jgi:hypothetical protein
MVTDTDAPSKRAAPPIQSYPYLVSEMSRARLIEVMESLHFNSRGECKVTLDEGVRDFLLRAIRSPR